MHVTNAFYGLVDHAYVEHSSFIGREFVVLPLDFVIAIQTCEHWTYIVVIVTDNAYFVEASDNLF